jgi:hypothetical protein
MPTVMREIQHRAWKTLAAAGHLVKTLDIVLALDVNNDFAKKIEKWTCDNGDRAIEVLWQDGNSELLWSSQSDKRFTIKTMLSCECE